MSDLFENHVGFLMTWLIFFKYTGYDVKLTSLCGDFMKKGISFYMQVHVIVAHIICRSLPVQCYLSGIMRKLDFCVTGTEKERDSLYQVAARSPSTDPH